MVTWAAVLLGLVVGAHVSAESAVAGVELVLRDEVIDLRENQQLRKKGTSGPSGFFTPADLVVGSIFLDVDGNARKVVSIYDDGGSTIIETVQPDVEEVFYSVYVPDQTIAVTRADIDPLSVHEGVTIRDATDEEAEASLVASSRSVIPSESTWLETDPDWMGADVWTADLNITIPIGSTPNLLDPASGDGDSKSDGSGSSGDSSSGDSEGGAETEVKVSAEITIKGVLRIAEPVVKAGLTMPSIHVTWVRVWWYFGYPKVTFDNGYLHASFDAAQQCDFNFEASLKLEAEVKIPLFEVIVVEPNTSLKFSAGVYLKIPISGEITLGFEICEYTTFGAWGTVDLVWPFIPVGVRTGSSHYENVIVRPYIDATVEVKTGIYLGFECSIAGINLLSAEVGGGVYAVAEGYLEAMNVIGYNTDVGSFGDWDDWRYEISLELGAYVEGGLGVLIWDIPLFEYRWPFLTLTASGEL